MDTTTSLYRGRRFPVEIISHCVWLYHRFPLSLRDVEEMTVERGVSVSYDTIHQWSCKFGQTVPTACTAAGPRTPDTARKSVQYRAAGLVNASADISKTRWSSGPPLVLALARCRQLRFINCPTAATRQNLRHLQLTGIASAACLPGGRTW